MTTTRSASYPFDDSYPGEDNYRTFLRDEVVYSVFDWDTLPAALVARHDALLETDLTSFEALDLSTLHDLELWAVARALRTHDAQAKRLDVMERMLQTDAASRRSEINYTELRLEYARALAFFDQNTHGAHAQLAIYREEPQADAEEADRLSGVLEVLFGDVQEGVKGLVELVGRALESDPELALDIAEELVEHEKAHAALRVLRGALEHATSKGHRSAVLDLEEAVSVFPELPEEPTATPSAPSAPVVEPPSSGSQHSTPNRGVPSDSAVSAPPSSDGFESSSAAPQASQEAPTPQGSEEDTASQDVPAPVSVLPTDFLAPLPTPSPIPSLDEPPTTVSDSEEEGSTPSDILPEDVS